LFVFAVVMLAAVVPRLYVPLAPWGVRFGLGGDSGLAARVASVRSLPDRVGWWGALECSCWLLSRVRSPWVVCWGRCDRALRCVRRWCQGVSFVSFGGSGGGRRGALLRGSGPRSLVLVVVVLCAPVWSVLPCPLCIPLVLRGVFSGLGAAPGLLARAAVVGSPAGPVSIPPCGRWGALERWYGGSVPWCLLIVVDVVEDHPEHSVASRAAAPCGCSCPGGKGLRGWCFFTGLLLASWAVLCEAGLLRGRCVHPGRGNAPPGVRGGGGVGIVAGAGSEASD